MINKEKADLYKSKALNILEEFIELKEEYNTKYKEDLGMNDHLHPYGKMEEIFIRFSLLVYSFDPNNPLNKVVSRVHDYKLRSYYHSLYNDSNELIFKDFVYLITLFTDYLDEFFLKTE